MKERVPTLIKEHSRFVAAKDEILSQWFMYLPPREILMRHQIDVTYFIEKYASGVFDYFMGVIAGEREIGDCPVMQELLTFLKFREISADELFEICSHFRRSMVDFSYDASLNSKALFDEISYIFDKNFRGILKYYTDTIFQKLIDARQEALQASEAKEFFLSNMSHEIRTPLNAILGFVNLLKEESISKKHQNYLSIIANSGENLLSIINDILDFSKLRSGEFTIEPKIFSLHDELGHTLELFVASANTKNITITSFISPAIPRELFGDALRLKQIVSNFLSNAVKFTPFGGVIDVVASYQEGILKVSVEDSGIGIAQDQIERIFLAFVQTQNKNSISGGTGLGLSISHQLAELMGGSVGVSSTLGKGSTFSLEIPIEVHNESCIIFDDIEQFQRLKMLLVAKRDALSFRQNSFLRYASFFGMNITIEDSLEACEFDVAIFSDDEVSSEFKQSVLNSSKKFLVLMNQESEFYSSAAHINYLCFPLYCSKIHTAFEELMRPKEQIQKSQIISQNFFGHILIAEDNEANQELIKILLSRYGLSYDIANNGLEAFELFKSKHYDLILMDMQMPVMDGNEAVASIRLYERERDLHHTPICALTANVIKGVKERGLASGYDTFLGKPVVLKELERVFASFLQVQNASEKRIEAGVTQIIEGLDGAKLQAELMLSSDELLMLLNLFIKKMHTTIPELQNAIVKRDYKKIALLAHNIKGSSGNFRIESLQKSASEMEKMAKNEVEEFDYEAVSLEMKGIIESIKIL